MHATLKAASQVVHLDMPWMSDENEDRDNLPPPPPRVNDLDVGSAPPLTSTGYLLLTTFCEQCNLPWPDGRSSSPVGVVHLLGFRALPSSPPSASRALDVLWITTSTALSSQRRPPDPALAQLRFSAQPAFSCLHCQHTHTVMLVSSVSPR